MRSDVIRAAPQTEPLCSLLPVDHPGAVAWKHVKVELAVLPLMAASNTAGVEHGVITVQRTAPKRVFEMLRNRSYLK